MTLTIEELHAFDDLPAPQRQPGAARPATAQDEDDGAEVDWEKHLFGKDGFSFADLLDIINPLQHIPVISTIYREITGDEIAMLPRILGGTLFGGPIGAGTAIVNAALYQETGKDVGGHVLALFKEEEAPAALAGRDAEPAEADMVTAAGTRKGGQKVGAVTAAPIAAPVVEPSAAELAILATEAETRQSPQISWRTERLAPRGAAVEIKTAAAAEAAEAAAKRSSQIAWRTERPAPRPTTGAETANAPLVAPSAAEENILVLERALSRAERHRTAPPKVAPFAAAPARAAETNMPSPSPAATAPSPWFSFAPSHPKSAANTAGPPPRGALASDGGWFSDVMVSALTKYEQSKHLKLPPARAVNQVN